MGVCFTTLYLVVCQCVNMKPVPGTYQVRVPGKRTYYVTGKFCFIVVLLQPETTRMKRPVHRQCGNNLLKQNKRNERKNKSIPTGRVQSSKAARQWPAAV